SIIEHKLADHTADSIKHYEAGIKHILDQYNKACGEMAGLIKQCKAPQNLVAPEPISTKMLFDLNVDDAIWQDIRLDEVGDVDNPPLWLCDNKVKKGIQGVLLRDWCDEELWQLKIERRNLSREWFCEEWQIVNDSLDLTSHCGKFI
ncbi:hypothetical protein BDP27DRAFT_1237586, partial [Rhodocollybia butyracea]